MTKMNIIKALRMAGLDKGLAPKGIGAWPVIHEGVTDCPDWIVGRTRTYR